MSQGVRGRLSPASEGAERSNNEDPGCQWV